MGVELSEFHELFRLVPLADEQSVTSRIAGSPCTQSGHDGVRHSLMCNNSELRALYDKYSQLDISWLHGTPYHTSVERRCCFGLLSMQVWRMMVDGGVLSSKLPLAAVSAVVRQCTTPPAAIMERRKRVLGTASYGGVWTFSLADHSPYQEILYPEFCAILVRVSALCFSSMPKLITRIETLLHSHLLPLLAPRTPSALQMIEENTSLLQYLQLMQPLLKLVFTAASVCIQMPDGDQEPYIKPYEAQPSEGVSGFKCVSGGLTVLPDLSQVAASLSSQPKKLQTHPLDATPTEPSDSCIVSIRQLLYLLQQCGFVGAADRCLSCHQAVQAIMRGCFPTKEDSFMAGGPSASPVAAQYPQAPDAALCGLHLTYLEFVLALISISADVVCKDEALQSKFKSFLDGPRGFLAEALRAVKATIPQEMSERFSYLASKAGMRSTRGSIARSRSRKSGVISSGISGSSSLSMPLQDGAS